MLNVDAVGSDDWMLHRLAVKLGAGFERLSRLRKYRDGDALIPAEAFGSSERDAYLRFARLNRLHVVELLRDARTSRQSVVGFRTAADSDDNGDEVAWSLWSASGMKAFARDFFNNVADYASAFLIVDAPLRAGDRPVIRRLSPWKVAVERDPVRPWESSAAIEVGFDSVTECDWIRLWRRDTEGRVYMRLAWRKVGERSLIPDDGSSWVPGTDWTWDDQVVQLGVSRVPVFEGRTLSGAGVWEKHIDTIDRINYVTLQGMQLMVTQAYRQAAISGDLPATYPADDPFGRAGQQVDYAEIYKTGPAALWRLPKDSKVHEFSPVDPRPLREWRDDEIKKLAAFTSTPYYMLSSDSANQSAQGAALAADGLVSQVESMNDLAELAISQAVSVGFEFVGDSARAELSRIETLWAPLKRPSLAEIGDAASKLKQGGATQRWIDENVLGMTPNERSRAQSDRDAELALADAFSGLDGGAYGGIE